MPQPDHSRTVRRFKCLDMSKPALRLGGRSCGRAERSVRSVQSVRSVLLMMSVMVGVTTCSSSPASAQQHSRAPRNFFTEDQSAQAKGSPGFNNAKLSEADKQNRAIPDIRLVRSLPGLDNETRKKINAVYKTWQDGNADLRNQLQLNQSQVTKATAAASTSAATKSNDPVATTEANTSATSATATSTAATAALADHHHKSRAQRC